jgi:chromate transporter
MITLLEMALVFFKIGALIFGGEMSMLAFIQQDVVYNYGWITEQEFVDSVAMGQITPGPIVISSVFIGYKIAMAAGLPGIIGSLVAMTAITLPSFLMTVIATHWFGRISRHRGVRATLRGLAPAVVGLILAAGFTIGRTSISSPVTLDVMWQNNAPVLLGAAVSPSGAITTAIAVASFVALARFKVDTAVVLLGAGLIGMLFL